MTIVSIIYGEIIGFGYVNLICRPGTSYVIAVMDGDIQQFIVDFLMGKTGDASDDDE